MTDTSVLAHAVADRLLELAESIAKGPEARLVTSLNPETEQHVLDWLGIESEEPEPPVAPALPVKEHGDPSLSGDGLLIAIDSDCPHCGWPERWYDTRVRKFGCIKCTYTSDERAA